MDGHSDAVVRHAGSEVMLRLTAARAGDLLMSLRKDGVALLIRPYFGDTFQIIGRCEVGQDFTSHNAKYISGRALYLNEMDFLGLAEPNLQRSGLEGLEHSHTKKVTGSAFSSYVEIRNWSRGKDDSK